MPQLSHRTGCSSQQGLRVRLSHRSELCHIHSQLRKKQKHHDDNNDDDDDDEQKSFVRKPFKMLHNAVDKIQKKHTTKYTQQ